MGATVFFQTVGGEDVATLEMVFKVGNTPTDPTAVTCAITDPTGITVLHTFGGASPADITKASTGDYKLNIGSTIMGLWGYAWIGTGAASDVQGGTWTVGPASTLNQFYTSVEELKSRLKITDTNDDFELAAAVAAAADAIQGYTGRHFYQLTETRTYPPYDLYELPIDDLVSVSSFKTDQDGDGVFETVWTQNTDYQLAIAENDFNQMATGVPRPYTLVKAINASGGGKFFPFAYPFSHLDRIQITGVWGWPVVPQGVRQAALQTAAEIYKLKDSPFGLAGSSEFGVMRIPRQNPYITKLLNQYISGRRRVGV
jgi:hypothetical protein